MTTIFEALTAVMGEVGAVRKGEVNTQQGFRFRGIDAVVNAVAPSLRKHGVIVTPNLIEHQMLDFETGKGSKMYRALVRVEYVFHGPDGDHLSAVVMGEASDSLDKATSKAMSVAFRTALLQTLALPTDDPDPDSFNPPAMQKGEPTTRTKLTAAKAKLWQAAQARGWDKDVLSQAYFEATGAPIGEASFQDLDAYRTSIEFPAPDQGEPEVDGE